MKTSGSAYQGDLFSRQRAQTYIKMFHSDELAQTVIDKLALNITPQQLVSQVSASAVKGTVLMTISVTDAIRSTRPISPTHTATSWEPTSPSSKTSPTTRTFRPLSRW